MSNFKLHIKRIFAAAVFASGVFLTGDGLFLAMRANLNIGTILTLAAGAVFIIYGIWHKRLARAAEKGIMRILKYAVLAVMILVLCIMTFLLSVGHRDSVSYDEDAVIVLGAAVHGSTVSRPLGHRLDKAAEYSRKNPDALIIVSGGKGPQENITEAFAMEQYLIKKGVSKEKIVKEEKATSTYENFKFSQELLDSRFGKEYRCAYITNRFHLYRAGKLGQLTGVTAGRLGADLDWYVAPSAYLRETLAVVKLWLLKR